MLRLDLTPFVMYDEWQIPFLRRKTNELFDKYFSGNGYYPNDGNYYTDIRLNLQVFCDQNGLVSSMSYYKVHDQTMGHGKPVLRDADLSAKDISVFTKALSLCTVSESDKELDEILKRGTGRKLKNGWKIEAADKRSVEFINSTGAQIKIPRSRICKALDVSHNYLEVLSYREFWEANADFLRIEDADPLLSLFALVDPINYYEYDILVSESKKRIFESEKKARLEIISEAAKEGNAREVKKQINCIPKEILTGEDLVGPLCNAIRQKNEPLAKMLLKQGADVNGNYSYNDKHYGPLVFTIDNDWELFLSLCLKHAFDPSKFGNQLLVSYAFDNQKPNMAFMLLKAGAHFAPLIRSKQTKPEYIPKLLKYPSVDWGMMGGTKWVFESLDLESIKYVVKHLKDENGYLRSGFFSVVMETKDADFIDYYMKHCDPELCFRFYYLIKNDGSYIKTWKPYYKKALLSGENGLKSFFHTGLTMCIEKEDYGALAYLIGELQANPDEKQSEQIIEMIRKKYDESLPLVPAMLQNCVFVDDGEWHGVSSYSTEDIHNFKVDRSNTKKLLGIVLSHCDEDLYKMVKDYHLPFFEEPWAFGSLYHAVKANQNESVRKDAFSILFLTAKTILAKYSSNRNVVWTPTHRVSDLVNEAKELEMIMTT